MSIIKAIFESLKSKPAELKKFVRSLYRGRKRKPGLVSATKRYAGGVERKRKKHVQVHENGFLRRMFRSTEMKVEKKIKFARALEAKFAGDDSLMTKYLETRAKKRKKSIVATGPQTERRRQLLKKREERARA